MNNNKVFLYLFVFIIGSFFIIQPHAYGQTLEKNVLKAFTYRSIGPTRQGGRFVDFAVPSQRPYTFYAATASGGLWKTTNNGQSFKPIFDHEKVFSIGDIAVAPSNPDIVWVGTGEANNSRSSYWGDGVYKSTNAGKTWENMGLEESHHIGRIVIHPDNPDIVYVAALGHLYSENPERGLYKTENGGKTWTKVLDVVVKGKHIGVVDVCMNPENSDVLYACTYDKERKPWTFNLGGPGSRIYKTTDAGKTWTQLGGGLPEGMLGRIGIDIYDKNPNILYATIENANKPDMSDEERYQELREGKSSRGMIGGEVYRSDDAGKTWKKVSPDDKSIGGAPAYYYGQIIIDPNDDKVVHVLSAASWGTKDGGKSWQRRPLRFGGDDHALWIDPDNSNHMLLGYDHGMGVTFDGGKNWYHPDFMPLAQFYAVGVDMSYPYNVAGGTQDNGSLMGPSTKRSYNPIRLEDWNRVGGGDGMYNVFDTKNNRYLYNESQFGPLSRLDLKTGERKNIAYQSIREDLRWNWNSPVLISPHDNEVIYHGGNILVKSTNRGESWEEISPDLTTNDPKKLTTGKGGDGNIQYCTITTIDESPLEKGLLWVGTDDGNVWITKDDGENWQKLNDNIKGNPGWWVSRVTASHHDPGTAYVSYTGYRRDDFKAYVYKTTDYGETWISIAGSLPEEPINVIKEDHKNPNLLFIGTEFGVYVSIDCGKNWTKMESNMPTQPVHDLLIHSRENDLVVATHGRGIFITDITPLQELTSEVLSKDVYLFDVESKVRWVDNDFHVSSSSNFNGKSEPQAIIVNYYLKEDTKEEVKLTVYKGNVPFNEIKGSKRAGINKILWHMDRRRKRTEEEKKRIKEMIERYAEYGYHMDVDIEYKKVPVQLGKYRLVLSVGDKNFTKNVSVLKDHWFDK
ncbi:MAG: WD40/YVTN/BNR-like repeat-containing protein [Candidatus Aminicenantaceae bacterium]